MTPRPTFAAGVHIDVRNPNADELVRDVASGAVENALKAFSQAKEQLDDSENSLYVSLIVQVGTGPAAPDWRVISLPYDDRDGSVNLLLPEEVLNA